MNELHVGIIGLGKMGLLHAGILNSLPNVKVQAITDTEKFVINFIKKNNDSIQVYSDYKKMVENSKLDFVYITTPVASHIPIASYCASKKIHFFVEKPLGRNIDECSQLYGIVKQNNVLSMVGFYLRYKETFKKAKAMLDSGILGQTKNIKSSVYQTQSLATNSGWRFKKEISGGGVLIDLGSHLIDLLLWFFGRPKTLEASTKSRNSKQVEHTASGKIQFENGLECFFDSSWVRDGYRLQETTIEIEGEYGKMKVNEDYVKINYTNSEKSNQKQDSIFYSQSLYQGVPIDIGGSEYTLEDMDFIECIRNKKQSQLSILSSIDSQCVIDSIYNSAKIHDSVKVSYLE